MATTDDPKLVKLVEVAELLEDAFYRTFDRAMNPVEGEEKNERRKARAAWKKSAQAFYEWLNDDYEAGSKRVRRAAVRDAAKREPANNSG